MHLVACKLKNVPLTVQFCAQTTWPSGSTVWLGGKFRLMEKDALAPVRVGPSFFKSNVTWPPSNRDNTQFHSFQTDKVSMFVCFLFYCHWKRSDEEAGWRKKKKKRVRTSPDQQFRNLGSPSFHTGYSRVFHERYLVNWLLESVKMNHHNYKTPVA